MRMTAALRRKLVRDGGDFLRVTPDGAQFCRREERADGSGDQSLVGEWNADSENRVADASNFDGWAEGGGVCEAEKALREDRIPFGNAGEFSCRDRFRLQTQQRRGGRR